MAGGLICTRNGSHYSLRHSPQQCLLGGGGKSLLFAQEPTANTLRGSRVSLYVVYFVGILERFSCLARSAFPSRLPFVHLWCSASLSFSYFSSCAPALLLSCSFPVLFFSTFLSFPCLLVPSAYASFPERRVYHASTLLVFTSSLFLALRRLFSFLSPLLTTTTTTTATTMESELPTTTTSPAAPTRPDGNAPAEPLSSSPRSSDSTTIDKADESFSLSSDAGDQSLLRHPKGKRKRTAYVPVVTRHCDAFPSLFVLYISKSVYLYNIYTRIHIYMYTHVQYICIYI